MSETVKKAIVTTTINPVTEALRKYVEIARQDGWTLYIVGDQKTPHDEYERLQHANPEHVVYITPDMQHRQYTKLSNLIGWNCIQRRNFGFIWAYRDGAEIMATVDDDNIPYDGWGRFLSLGHKPLFAVYDVDEVFDPFQATNEPKLWHRGFPIQLLRGRDVKRREMREPDNALLVQAEFWDGEPDVDAIGRIANGPFDVKFAHESLFAGDKPGPFNSQNTFLHRSLFPHYFLFPHIGRMDDIWASYYVQALFPGTVAYGPATVYQARNDHDLSKDLAAEMLGYRFTLELVRALFEPGITYGERMVRLKNYIGGKSFDAYLEYMDIFKKFPTTSIQCPLGACTAFLADGNAYVCPEHGSVAQKMERPE